MISPESLKLAAEQRLVEAQEFWERLKSLGAEKWDFECQPLSCDNCPLGRQIPGVKDADATYCHVIEIAALEEQLR